ncbi:P-loop NTPase family protein [Micromonospora carbonacea]|uniref:hypothetical protein n=1 Tax=Micromonospora carbonacea TaxID=47853 RepID=UPI0037179567
MSTTAKVPAEVTDTEQPSGLGAQATPWAVMGALVVAAGACRIAATATGAEQETALTVAGVAFTAAVVTAWATRRRITDRRTRHRFVAALYLAAGWLATVTAIGLSWGAVAALTIFGCGLSLLWWREHRIGPGLPAAPTAAAGRVYGSRWAENVACPGGALPGSKVSDEHPVVGGTRFTVRLVPGKQELATVTGAFGKIRTGLGLRRTDELMAEDHPTLDQSHVQVTILEKAPVLMRDNVWPGGGAYDPKTGRVALGPYVDGEWFATWRVYTSDSIWGGFLVGGQGSGKTRMMEGIVMSVVAATPTVVFFADGHGESGASSRLLRDHADYFAGTPDQLRVMLRGLHHLGAARLDDMMIDDLEGFTPTEDRPGLILVIDECHKFFEHDDIQELTANLITEYRKIGITVIAATQTGMLDRAFGTGKHADALRSALLTGNGVVLRIKSASIKDVLKLGYDPREFPPVAGYGRLVDEERAVAFRGFRVTDQQVATLPKQMRWRCLSVGEAAAFGPGYAERKQTRARARAEALARRQARLAGVHVPAPATAPAGAGAGVQPQVVAELLEDVVFPVWPGSMQPEFELTDSHRRLLDAVASGATRAKDIQDAMGLSKSRFHQLAPPLLAHGYLGKTGQGPAAKYHLTELGMARAA